MLLIMKLSELVSGSGGEEPFEEMAVIEGDEVCWEQLGHNPLDVNEGLH